MTFYSFGFIIKMENDPSGHFLPSALITGFFIVATIGFAATVYSDYKDDGQVFNGSVSSKDYVVYTIVDDVMALGVRGE
ncbi:MAG: hypothetical protein IKB38_10705 [Clostridia bacterium]|nr:hypothetical protein [Clostridia bacterium]MBR2467384.1 hypothetical protein [Clostridia bacterium]